MSLRTLQRDGGCSRKNIHEHKVSFQAQCQCPLVSWNVIENSNDSDHDKEWNDYHQIKLNLVNLFYKN